MGGREKREESQNTMEVVIEVGRPHEGEEEEEEEESAAVGSIKCNWVQQGKGRGDGWPVDRATHTSLLGSTCLQWGREVGIHSIILTHHTKKLSSLTE